MLPNASTCDREETLPVRVQCGVQEQTYQLEVPHFFEPAVSGLHRAAHDSKLAPLHLLAQQVVFRIQCLFVKPTKRVEPGAVEKHEHAGAKRFVKT